MRDQNRQAEVSQGIYQKHIDVSPVNPADVENNILRRLKQEAHQQQLDTQRAMDKLSQLQNEIYLK